jgi:hypothetical protein
MMTTRRWIAVLVAGGLLAACGGDDGDGDGDGDDGGDSAPEPATVDEPAATAAPAESDASDDASGDASPAGATGRLEIDGETYDLRLGDMTTAMCSVSESSVVIQDMRAPDGSWVGASYNATDDVWGVTFRDSDGNRRWETGNSEGAEGLAVDYLIADNVFSVSGYWMSADYPSSTTEGQLVVTC